MIESRNMHYAFGYEYPNVLINSSDNEAAIKCNKKILNIFRDTKNLQEIFDIGNAQLITFGAKEIDDNADEEVKVWTKYFKVMYPGLLIGLGYPHEVSDDIYEGNENKPSEGQIQLGFTFDYVTGVPIYPGSSVKGIINHIYKEYDANIKDALNNEDIFYGGYIVGAVNAGKEYPYSLLAIENITPHKSPIKNPIPLSLLKISPNTCIAICIKAPKSRALTYFEILEDMGIGAKTNVGFGVVEEVDKNKIKTEAKDLNVAKPEIIEVSSNDGHARTEHSNNNHNGNQNRNNYEVGKEYKGIVIGYDENNNKATVKLEDNRGNINIHFSKVGAKPGKISEKLKKNNTYTFVFKGMETGNNNRQYPNWSLKN